MKIALITDQHFGARNDNENIQYRSELYLSKVFFPALDKEGISDIVSLGDTFDNPKNINVKTLDRAKNNFFKEIANRGIKHHILLGNHDTYYRNTNSISAIKEIAEDSKELFSDTVIYEYPETVILDDLNALFLPWICKENEEQSLDMIQNTKANVAFGHLELTGFEWQKNVISTHGFDPSIFKRFISVYSGHFHHRNTLGNVHYMGSLGQYNRGDAGTKRGGAIFNTTTGLIERYIENPYHNFWEVYPEQAMSLTEDDAICSYVTIHSKKNTENIDDIVNHLESKGAASVTVIPYFEKKEEEEIEYRSVSSIPEIIDMHVDNEYDDGEVIKEKLKNYYTKAVNDSV